MELSGKAKEKFEKWLLKLIEDLREDLHGYSKSKYLIDFYKEIDSMQYGVYVDFFDSVGVFVMDIHNEVNRKFYYDISTKPMSNDITSDHDFTRPEARTKAIEKANELLNERL